MKIKGIALLNGKYLEQVHHACQNCLFLCKIFKGYCTSSKFNCGMAKSLAQARACEGLLAGDLTLPQLILEQVQ